MEKTLTSEEYPSILENMEKPIVFEFAADW